MTIQTIADLDRLRDEGLKTLYPEKTKIMVGSATCGISAGALKVKEAIEEAVKAEGLDAVVTTVGCIGFCQAEPLVDFWAPGRPRISYRNVTVRQAATLVKAWKEGRIERDAVLGHVDIDRHAAMNPLPDPGKNVPEGVPGFSQIPFYAKQEKIAMRNCGFIDPTSLEEYIARGGYYPFVRTISGETRREPGAVIDEVDKAKLRGRGGGGFATARKWRSCAKAPAPEGKRYLLCNADEGDPGAFMDRSIIEGDPHAVLEGMLLAAYAIGASQGYIYCRLEYPLAVTTLTRAIRQAREQGLLGDNILGTGFSFDIKINRGGGAFVCGESTALMASIEGKPGEPRPKHIHTAEKGLFDAPTTLNNVETLANVPVILEKGADWYTQWGSEGSKGTKVFALVGRIVNTGLVEVPMGITLREIVEEIGGGIRDGGEFKAVQTGGPSGGCLPASSLDQAVDFDTLTKLGAMMGSGGMIVMDTRTCMVDVARYFIDFLEDESCGKCTACREGLHRAKQVLTRITLGEGREGDLELLEDIGFALEHGSLCALGQSAAFPVLSTIKYFRDEYEAHIRNQECPAGVCRELINYVIDPDKCDGCHICFKKCPSNCISGEPKQAHRIDQTACIRCGVCFDVCRPDAIRIVPAHSNNPTAS